MPPRASIPLPTRRRPRSAVPRRAGPGGCSRAGPPPPPGAGCRLPLPGHVVEGDVGPVLLVPGEQEGAGPSTPERPQRAVAPEDEFALDKGWGCVGHRLSRVGGDTDKSFTLRE